MLFRSRPLPLVLVMVLGGCGGTPTPMRVTEVKEARPLAEESSETPRPSRAPADIGMDASVATTSTSGCAKPCRGSVSDDLVKAIQESVQRAHRCYDNALVGNESLRGRVMIELLVGADGNICAATVVSKEKGMESVASCASAVVGGESYPAPMNGCVSIRVPINYLPKDRSPK